MRSSRWLLGIILCMGALSAGCATRAVWGIKSCAPAPDPKLTLAFSPEKYDILVTYQEKREWTKSVQTNSYWLLANADHPPKDHRPVFVQETNFSDLVTIPVVKWSERLPETGYSAKRCNRIDSASAVFDLYHEGVCVGQFTLPNYSTHAGPATVSRVALTPPAVLADTATIAAILAFVAAYVYAQGR